VLLLTALAACDTVFPPEAQPVAQPAEQSRSNLAFPPGTAPVLPVGPGDRLQVTVFDNPDLSQTVTVGPDGAFRYPLVGRIRARGRSLGQIEAALTSGLSENIVDPQVTVGLVEVRGYQIFVQGEVLRPGVFEVDGPVTVTQALAMAGGFTAFTTRDRILVYNPTRAGRRFLFDYDAFITNPDARDVALLPGDSIIVP